LEAREVEASVRIGQLEAREAEMTAHIAQLDAREARACAHISHLEAKAAKAIADFEALDQEVRRLRSWRIVRAAIAVARVGRYVAGSLRRNGHSRRNRLAGDSACPTKTHTSTT